MNSQLEMNLTSMEVRMFQLVFKVEIILNE